MKQITLFALISLFLISCSGYKTVSSSKSTVPSGTEISYSKVMNPAYAKDYIGADIITKVEFYAPNASNMWQTKVPKNHIVFQVTPIGGEAKSNPLGGGKLGDYVFIPKDKGEIVFDLKRGDKIKLTGGTRIRKAVIGNVEIIEFIATSITKL